MLEGIVKSYNVKKCFGFIMSNEGEEIFFHCSQLMVEGHKTIEEGTKVVFERLETDRGIQAHNIMRI